MGIISLTPDVAGQTGNLIGGVAPRRVAMVTTDSLATITTAGYLNNVQREMATAFYPTDVFKVWYNYVSSSSPGTYDEFTLSFSNGVITMVQEVSAGNVLLPVVSGHFANFNGTTGQIKDSGFLPSNAAKTRVVMANGATISGHIAVYSDTTGTISEDVSPAINGGSIQAGLSGTAGNLIAYPAAATSGRMVIAPVTNSAGDFSTTISNASSVGQSQVISIPDSGAATANFILSASGSAQTISGGLTVSTGNLNVSQGNVVAGSSGHAGTVSSFPSTAGNGELILAAVNAGGAFNTTISNGTIGQSSVITIPDPGAATANFVISSLVGAGTQHITSGSLQVDAGSLISGLATGGTQGTLQLFPSGATAGSLELKAVGNSGNFAVTLENAIFGQATVLTIPDPGMAAASVVINPTSLVNGNIIEASGTGGLVVDTGIAALNVTITKVFTLTFTQLAAAGKVNIQVHTSATSQFFIQDVKVLKSTGLSGGGGDRLLAITDGTLVFNNAGITAALLGTPVFTLWGGAGNPEPVGASDISTAGADIYFQYTGGAADYAAGSVQIAVTYVKVTA